MRSIRLHHNMTAAVPKPRSPRPAVISDLGLPVNPSELWVPRPKVRVGLRGRIKRTLTHTNTERQRERERERARAREREREIYIYIYIHTYLCRRFGLRALETQLPGICESNFS